ncbi:hypothetical protein HDU76_000227 [Blyttiomyces sp. JEL0837]|nr:hypothetical protein HDU76_000227 [Blyttiomyces sp. JEL0837]
MIEPTLLPLPNKAIECLGRHNAPIRVVNDPDIGRYAVASRPIAFDEVVLKTRPYGMALFQRCRKDACAACYGYSINSNLTSGCSVCASVSYCSEQCRNDRSQFHSQFECSYLTEISKVPSGKAFDKWRDSFWNGKTKGKDDHDKKPDSGLMLKLIGVYERFDVQDLARWALNFCLRGVVEMKGLVESSNVVDGIPFPTYEEALELVPNIEGIPKDELIQLEGLYTLLSHLSQPKPSNAKSTSTNRQQHDDSANTDDTTTTNTTDFPLPPTFSELFKWRFPQFDDYVKVMSIRQCNGFGLWDGAKECLGQALYPIASFFNHSCDPNLVRGTGMVNLDEKKTDLSSVASHIKAITLNEQEGQNGFDRRELNGVMRALLREPVVTFWAGRDIAEGEPLFLSYIDESQSLERRKESLKTVYYFDCRCSKCIREEEEKQKTMDPDREEKLRLARKKLSKFQKAKKSPGGTGTQTPVAGAVALPSDPHTLAHAISQAQVQTHPKDSHALPPRIPTQQHHQIPQQPHQETLHPVSPHREQPTVTSHGLPPRMSEDRIRSPRISSDMSRPSQTNTAATNNESEQASGSGRSMFGSFYNAVSSAAGTLINTAAQELASARQALQEAREEKARVPSRGNSPVRAQHEQDALGQKTTASLDREPGQSNQSLPPPPTTYTPLPPPPTTGYYATRPPAMQTTDSRPGISGVHSSTTIINGSIESKVTATRPEAEPLSNQLHQPLDQGHFEPIPFSPNPLPSSSAQTYSNTEYNATTYGTTNGDYYNPNDYYNQEQVYAGYTATTDPNGTQASELYQYGSQQGYVAQQYPGYDDHPHHGYDSYYNQPPPTQTLTSSNQPTGYTEYSGNDHIPFGDAVVEPNQLPPWDNQIGTSSHHAVNETYHQETVPWETENAGHETVDSQPNYPDQYQYQTSYPPPIHTEPTSSYPVEPDHEPIPFGNSTAHGNDFFSYQQGDNNVQRASRQSPTRQRVDDAVESFQRAMSPGKSVSTPKSPKRSGSPARVSFEQPVSDFQQSTLQPTRAESPRGRPLSPRPLSPIPFSMELTSGNGIVDSLPLVHEYDGVSRSRERQQPPSPRHKPLSREPSPIPFSAVVGPNDPSPFAISNLSPGGPTNNRHPELFIPPPSSHTFTDLPSTDPFSEHPKDIEPNFFDEISVPAQPPRIDTHSQPRSPVSAQRGESSPFNPPPLVTTNLESSLAGGKRSARSPPRRSPLSPRSPGLTTAPSFSHGSKTNVTRKPSSPIYASFGNRDSSTTQGFYDGVHQGGNHDAAAEREALTVQIMESRRLMEVSVHERLELQAKYEDAVADRERYKSELESVKARMAGLMDIAVAVEEVESLRGDIATAKSRLEKWERELKGRERALEEKEHELVVHGQSQVEDVDAEMRGRIAEVETGIKELELKREAVEKKEKMIEEKLAESRKVHEQALGVQSKAENMLAEAALKEEDIKRRQAELNEERLGLETLRGRLEEDKRLVGEEMNTYRMRFDSLKAQEDELQRRAVQMEEEYKSHRTRETHLESERRWMESESLRLEELRRSIEQDRQMVEEERASLLSKESQVRARNDEYLSEIAAASEEGRRLAELRREFDEDRERLEAERSALLEREARVKKGHDEILQRAASVNEENSRIFEKSRELEDREALFKRAEADLASKRMEVDNAAQSLQELRMRSEEMFKQREDSLVEEKSKMNSLSRELEHERQRIADAEKRLRAESESIRERERALAEHKERSEPAHGDAKTNSRESELAQRVAKLESENKSLISQLKSGVPSEDAQARISELEKLNRQFQGNILRLTEMLDADNGLRRGSQDNMSSPSGRPSDIDQKLSLLEKRLQQVAEEEFRLKEAFANLMSSQADFEKFRHEAQPLIEQFKDRAKSDPSLARPSNKRSTGLSVGVSEKSASTTKSREWGPREVEALQESALAEIITAGEYDKMISNKSTYDLLNVIVSLTSTNQTLSRKLEEAQQQIPSSPMQSTTRSAPSTSVAGRSTYQRYSMDGNMSSNSVHDIGSRFFESSEKVQSSDDRSMASMQTHPPSSRDSLANGSQRATGKGTLEQTPDQSRRSEWLSRGYVTDDGGRYKRDYGSATRSQPVLNRKPVAFSPNLTRPIGRGDPTGKPPLSVTIDNSQTRRMSFSDADDGNVDSYSDRSDFAGPVSSSSVASQRFGNGPGWVTGAPSVLRGASKPMQEVSSSRNQGSKSAYSARGQQPPGGSDINAVGMPTSADLLGKKRSTVINYTSAVPSRRPVSAQPGGSAGKSGESGNDRLAGAAGGYESVGSASGKDFPRTVSLEGLRSYFTDEDLASFSETTRKILFGDANKATRSARPSTTSNGHNESTPKTSKLEDSRVEEQGVSNERKESIRDIIRARVKERDMGSL